MKEKLDWYRVVCNGCQSSAVIYVPEGHNPIMSDELADYRIYPKNSDRNHEYHLCPDCQKEFTRLKVIKGDKA